MDVQFTIKTVFAHETKSGKVRCNGQTARGQWIQALVPIGVKPGDVVTLMSIYAVTSELSIKVQDLLAFAKFLLKLVVSGATGTQVHNALNGKDADASRLFFINQTYHPEAIVMPDGEVVEMTSTNTASSADRNEAQALLDVMNQSAAQALGVEQTVVTPKPAGKRKTSIENAQDILNAKRVAELRAASAQVVAEQNIQN